MNQLELQNAMKLIEKFEELYEELEIEIDNDGDLKISCDYFNYKNVNQLEQVIIDYKRIIKG